MADQKTGTVLVGTITDTISIGNGQAGTWTHNLGVKAQEVRVINEEGQVLGSDPAVTQPDANSIEVANTAAGALTVYIVAVFQQSTIGVAGEVAASEVVVA